jgi:hypothetical protein
MDCLHCISQQWIILLHTLDKSHKLFKLRNKSFCRDVLDWTHVCETTRVQTRVLWPPYLHFSWGSLHDGQFDEQSTRQAEVQAVLCKLIHNTVGCCKNRSSRVQVESWNTTVITRELTREHRAWLYCPGHCPCLICNHWSLFQFFRNWISSH